MSQPPNQQLERVDPTSHRSARWKEVLDTQPRKMATTIQNGIAGCYPKVTESVFKKHVIPILCRILVPENKAAYKKLVVDLMMPLNVVSDSDPTVVLHTVPPIARTPLTTIPQLEGGLTVSDVLNNINRFRDLQRMDLHDGAMQGFLDRITILPDPIEDILLPIHRILRSYGHELDVTATAENPLGTASLPKSVEQRNEAATLSPPSDSFTEEEDED